MGASNQKKYDDIDRKFFEGAMVEVANKYDLSFDRYHRKHEWKNEYKDFYMQMAYIGWQLSNQTNWA